MKPRTCIKRATHTGTYTVLSLIGFPHWYSLCCFNHRQHCLTGHKVEGVQFTLCVFVCVRAQTAWSAVPSYRKSRGRPPLVICAGEVEHDSSFPPLYLPPFSFSRLTLSPFMSSASIHLSSFISDFPIAHCSPPPPPAHIYTASLSQPLVLTSFSSRPFPSFQALPLRKFLWRVVVVPYLWQYGAAWPNDWWKTFKAVFVNRTLMSRNKTFLRQ